MANILAIEKQASIISALAEGNSIRSIERMTGVHRDTIMRLGVRVGQGCEKLMDAKMRNLQCKRIECDELWAFIAKKNKRATFGERYAGYGDCWTYLALDPESKLIPAYLVGHRTQANSTAFMRDLRSRLANRIQLSTDAMTFYTQAVDMAFYGDVDYGQIVKEYSSPAKEEARRYSPAKLVSVYKTAVNGEPLPKLVCTSYVERGNLTMRTHCKRLARLTLAFSKKFANFKAAMGLNLAYYNFVKTHSTIRCTPAMAEGIEKTHLSIMDLIDAA